MREFVIGKNDAGQRADRFVAKAAPALAASLAQKYFRLKRIKVNSKRCERSQRLSEGDVMRMYIGDEYFGEKPKRAPRSGELSIVYEDMNILLADKPAGLLCHEADGSGDTLIDRIQAYLSEKGEWDAQVENTFAPALCNRIDRNTAGIVIAAKNAEALRIINEKIKVREIQKYYLCLVTGTPDPPEGILSDVLVKDKKDNYMTVSPVPVAGGVFAKTAYRVIRSQNGLSLLECELLTGRTHQIRAQLAHMGHPLAGDGKYGKNEINRALRLKHQALYSYRLRFSFNGGAGILTYLTGREFRVKNVAFEDENFSFRM